MALNPQINKLRAIGSIKIAGKNSLTISELVAMVFLVITVIPSLAKKVPIVKGHQQGAMYAALLFLFLVLWLD